MRRPSFGINGPLVSVEEGRTEVCLAIPFPRRGRGGTWGWLGRELLPRPSQFKMTNTPKEDHPPPGGGGENEPGQIDMFGRSLWPGRSNMPEATQLPPPLSTGSRPQEMLAASYLFEVRTISTPRTHEGSPQSSNKDLYRLLEARIRSLKLPHG